MKNSHSSAPDAKAALRNIKLFQSLDDESCDQIARLVKWKQYRQGTEIVPYKGYSDDVYFIATGQVRVTIFSFTGKEVSYQELGPGEMFGELSVSINCPAQLMF